MNLPTPDRAHDKVPPNAPVLLYDGECGVCAASVQWVLRHEHSTELRFAALQSEVGRHLLSEAGIDSSVDSLVWIEPSPRGLLGRVYSGAVLSTLRYVGGPWRIAFAALWLVPKPLRDWGYRRFASMRKLVLPSHCLLPTPAQRARFLKSAYSAGETATLDSP